MNKIVISAVPNKKGFLASIEALISFELNAKIVEAKNATFKDHILDNDVIFLTFPIYHNFPYFELIKFLQEAFIEDSAYFFDNSLQKNVGLLSDKTFVLVSSIGKPEAPDHYYKGLEELLEYCGVKNIKKCILKNIKPGLSELEYKNIKLEVNNQLKEFL